MGGDRAKKPAKAKAPTFAVWEFKDPDSGNLDRVDVRCGRCDHAAHSYDVHYS